ncbi:efflux transporter outer membrane subunit [Paraburkholderia megapolitana]|uniref:Efflux transporter, outer membrane factor (OMF) lipoprotein, NodT family n=1 Tax=Paraburkholderia megapolitana TaxID=420953 RepID=A0A1I3IRW0_9BURK|nr:efflux transporter outer membrane subunit [Paraburkholderia megapolitana]QDQ85076.1 efflux transporter outer membrane subunit [Paraburkholderia megapolitana]SFI50627.1 efflux transporter, outer membrane factor (OMF) lipoprotein, NodT family [Paraburkholderia megapolitana]
MFHRKLNRWRPAAHPGSRLAALLGTLALAGCASFGGTAALERITPPQQYDPGNDIRAATASGDIAKEWWKAFGDPSLDRLMQDALSDAPTLKAAQARVSEALAQADVRAADTLPQLDGAISAAPTRFPASYTVPPPAAGHWQIDAQALLNASFDLDLAGRLRALTRSATLRAGQQQALAQATTIALQSAIVTTYLQLDLACRLLGIAQDTLAQHNYLLRLTNQRVTAGLDMRLASLRASEPIPLAESEVAKRTADVALLRHRLAALAGRGPGYADTLVPAPSMLDARPTLPATLPAGLVGRRPDILAARYRVEAESAGIDAARAAFYPDINLLAFAGVQSLGFHALFNGNSGSFGAGPAISLPIFEGGRLRAGLRAQTAAYNAAVADYDDTVVNALAQVSDALVQIKALGQQQALTQEALARAQQAYDLETRRYRQGMSGYLDVLLAQGRLYEDEAAHAQAGTALLIEHVQLIAALGGAPTDGASP